MDTIHTSRDAKVSKKRIDFRDSGESLRRRLRTVAESMGAEDRALLGLVLEQGISFEQIARLRGEHPTTISRRFRQLIGRARTGAAAQAAAASERFGPLEIAILTEIYLRRTPHRDIIAKLGTSRYRIRKTLARLNGPA